MKTTDSTQATHTPGPWELQERPSTSDHEPIKAANGDFVAYALRQLRTEDAAIPVDPTERANARLIAAAPELLEALQVIAPDFYLLPTRVQAIARAAIAKATGREK